jgi:hypothetical protein
MLGPIDLSTYGGLNLDPAWEGMIADMNDGMLENYVNDQAAIIDFGQFAASSGGQNTSALTCKAPTVDADVLLGFAVRHATMPAAFGTDVVNYAQYATVPVFSSKGRIWVKAAENVTAMDNVLSITAGGANGGVGGTTGGAAGAGRVAFKPGQCRWITTTAAGSLGLIQID